MSKSKRKDSLQRLLNFTDEDLEANRQGYMTETQQKYVIRYAVMKMFLPLLLCFAIVFGVPLACGFKLAADGIFSLFFPVGLTLPFYSLAALWLMWTYMRYEYKQLEAKKKILHRVGKILPQELGFAGAYLSVNNELFVVSKEAYIWFSHLSQEQEEWIIYCDPTYKRILSAERLSD